MRHSFNAMARWMAAYANGASSVSIFWFRYEPQAQASPQWQIAQSASRCHASRNDRMAPIFANANII
jgi:hypothetical protein